MAEMTPMMKQYLLMKEIYKDCLLFFRLGDFYEMFFEDALTASKELEITLTGRDCGMAERAPMCGVPYHSVEGYINKLILKGYKVAICEQLTDPAESKGLVERDVVRVITPGTVVESSILNEKENSYILSAFQLEDKIGFSYADVSTGGFYIGEVYAKADISPLLNEIVRIQPKEILLNESLYMHQKQIEDVLKTNVLIHCYDTWAYEYNYAKNTLEEHYKTSNLSGFGCDNLRHGISAAGALMHYLKETQKNALIHINKIILSQNNMFMSLDASTRRNLELTKTMRDNVKKGSLLWLLDHTETSMGARLLKNWIEQPLQSREEIVHRQVAVGEIKDDIVLREGLPILLSGIYDLERLIMRISYSTLDAKNCIALKNSIKKIPDIKKFLHDVRSPLLVILNSEMDELSDICALIEESIAEDPPQSIKDGGIIKDGYDCQVDRYREASKKGKLWISELEDQEKKDTGIKNLKIGYNKIFGYYIEVTKSYLNLVPYRYIRKQTLANAERFVTPELKDMEETILNADEKALRLEYMLFIKIRDELSKSIGRIQKTAQAISVLDVILSFAQAAYENDYIQPSITESGEIHIKNGRHPVVEKTVQKGFVPNDANLDLKDNRLMIITGPNMAGKSTYMRQVGLLTLMAHTGSFIPADEASICVVDRIFTRVGASDDLASGQSTFMVEMNEVANILHNATSKSLLILDEIGRGTSTLDGLSIAWSVVEYLSDTKNIGAKTLFATHYHELTELEGIVQGVKNYSITVREYGEDIIFLHKIVRGGTNRSFGIEVAKLAGLPGDVITRAKDLLQLLTQADILKPCVNPADAIKGTEQMNFLNMVEQPVFEILRSTNTDNITPLQALGLLCELKAMIKE
jgi:DNA mismatch repair protein MutS